MSEPTRFLEMAALELVRQEGVRVVKSPGSSVPGWTYGWEEWDEVLVGEGPGVQPSIFAFKIADGLSYEQVQETYAHLVREVTAGALRLRSSLPVRLIAVFCFQLVDDETARRVARLVPDRYHGGLKPQTWVVDMSSGRLRAPSFLGIVPSRAQAATKRALEETLQGRSVRPQDLMVAEASAVSARAAFVSRMRSNVPYVTYALLVAIYAVFALEWLYGLGSAGSNAGEEERVLLHFGALQPHLVERGEIWLLFTAMFVHVSVVHILFNSIALYSVGTLVERIYGPLRYAFIYLVSGLFASAASYVYMAYIASGETYQIAAGASGAIFGIAGVVIVLGVLRHSIVPRAIALQLSLFMLILIVINIGFDAFTPDIDIRAHIGGLVVGLILGYVLAPRLGDVPGTAVRAPEVMGREL